MSNMGERYRRFMAAARSPEAARRRIVECARRHGATNAARMSGADRTTVQRLVKWADAGITLARESGSPPMSAREKGRILAAKRAHPEESARLIARHRDIPWSHRTITRVLREAGMLRKVRVPTRDPDHWIRWLEKQCLFAQIMFYLGMIARVKGATGRLADTEGPLRRAKVAAQKYEWWWERKEKARREGERSAANAIMTSAVPGRPGTDPDPDQALEAKMFATLAKIVKLAASALERVLADIQHKG